MAAPGSVRPKMASPGSDDTSFFGCQIGGKSAVNYSYTDMPWKLMAYDVYYFFKYSWAIPFILWPLTPADSGELSELSFTLKNAYAIAIHVVLVILQLGFILALPLLAVVPVWTAVTAIALFMLMNRALTKLLNGDRVEYTSEEKYAPALPEHAHEQWIYINGVAAGEHWMMANLNRLAVTFKRPIIGIHNKTAGILFDVIECLIQRNLGYATTDVRVCYSKIKRKLYEPEYSKVIFIMHSQGSIQGSLMLDWLLQELPQDLLSKLEIYTFGNAANHFNNPHRHLSSQTLAKCNPLAASVDSTRLSSAHKPLTSPPPPHALQTGRGSSASTSAACNWDPEARAEAQPADHPKNTNANSSSSSSSTITSSTTSPDPASLSGRAIGHIEHYAHTTDFVALWGVLHFATTTTTTTSPSSSSSSSSPDTAPMIPRFMGRVFARTSRRGGHQLVQHYLDGMFPLRRDPQTGGLLMTEAGVPWGAEEEEGANAFMESEVLLGGVDGDGDDGDGKDCEGQEGEDVEIIGAGGALMHEGARRTERVVRVKVKELSRLWQYRNGRSPEEGK